MTQAEGADGRRLYRRNMGWASSKLGRASIARCRVPQGSWRVSWALAEETIDSAKKRIITAENCETALSMNPLPRFAIRKIICTKRKTSSAFDRFHCKTSPGD
jgi:hypothetical protein